MNKEKISSQEIIDLVATKASVSKRAAEEFLKVMIATIEDALMAGEAVKIKGFGTFKLQWNEPRKSVNVQTGEEIILDGYYKVAFAPETSLKELVNEPFAHLEPVLLDGDNNFVIPEQQPEEVLDPLRIFTEQATEIKDLLSEIQALSAGSKSIQDEEVSVQPEFVLEDEIPVVEAVVDEELLSDTEVDEEEIVIAEEPEYEFQSEMLPVVESEIESEPEPEVVSEPVIEPEIQSPVEVAYEPVYVDSPYAPKAEIVTEAVVDEISNVSEVEETGPASDSTPFLVGIKKNKRRGWIWIPIAVILIGAVVGLYFFYAPAHDLGTKAIASTKTQVGSLSTKVSGTVSGWFTPKPKEVPVKAPETVVVPKDTTDMDSVEIKEPVDTLQQLFDNPREYEEFIGSEQIQAGSRLTVMSKKYYGCKDFWVYIYEANKERIENPDKIQDGTLIRIPKLDSRLIDASNPRCIQKAKELHDKYVKIKK